jgi:hypothetical protein
MVRILKGSETARRPIWHTQLGGAHAWTGYGLWRCSGADGGRVIRTRGVGLICRVRRVGAHCDRWNTALKIRPVEARSKIRGFDEYKPVTTAFNKTQSLDSFCWTYWVSRYKDAFGFGPPLLQR